MTDAAHTAEQGPFASIEAMITRLFLMLAALMRLRMSRRTFEAHARLARWFAWAEARVLAGDHSALLKLLMVSRRVKHCMVRDATIAGRFYKRRTRSNWIFCIEGRFSAPRTRRLSARARASIPFTHVNPAPP